MKTSMLSFVASILILLNLCSGHFTYVKRIPNGNSVPNPCPGTTAPWIGVGHTHNIGYGARNLFGLDFENAGHEWTRDLCMADSDGDGQTNGQELGDVNCVWSANSTIAPSGRPIGHPGICEPMTDPNCVTINTKSGVTC